jgi:hypothetical protein
MTRTVIYIPNDHASSVKIRHISVGEDYEYISFAERSIQEVRSQEANVEAVCFYSHCDSMCTNPSMLLAPPNKHIMTLRSDIY